MISEAENIIFNDDSLLYDKDDFNIINDFNFYQQPVRIIKPQINEQLKDRFLLIQNSDDLVKTINFDEEFFSYFCILNGNFIFGDFIQNFITTNDIIIKELTISTLSLNINNIYSLAFLLYNGWIDKLNLLVSPFYFTKNKNLLIPFIYETLDFENKFQFIISHTHCKVVCMETYSNKFITMHGSPNLCSSNNLEQIHILSNKTVYDFFMNNFNTIIQNFFTINKDVKGGLNRQQNNLFLKNIKRKDLWTKLLQA